MICAVAGHPCVSRRLRGYTDFVGASLCDQELRPTVMKMFTIKLSLCHLFLGLLVLKSSATKLRTVHEWKYVDFLWDNDADKEKALKMGDYNHTKPIIIDVGTWRDGRIFVTVIRNDGVPASLTTVSSMSGKGGPLLKPYPDWSWTKNGDCDGITNVYRFAMDECDRIWVLDNGQKSQKQVCPAQLLAFDLNNDHLVKRIKIPSNMSHNSKTNLSELITPIVETEGPRCEKTYVYITDVYGHALIVYGDGKFRRLESPSMGVQASAAELEIAGETFNLTDGLFAGALSPKISSWEPRYLMIRPFASRDMMKTTNWALQNSLSGEPVNFVVTVDVLPSPATALAFSSGGILFFVLTTETALACWDIKKPLKKENIVIVAQDRTTLQFASGVKIIPKAVTKTCEKILISTNRYQKFALGTQNFDEINYRVLMGCVDDLMPNSNKRWSFKELISRKFFKSS